MRKLEARLRTPRGQLEAIAFGLVAAVACAIGVAMARPWFEAKSAPPAWVSSECAALAADDARVALAKRTLTRGTEADRAAVVALAARCGTDGARLMEWSAQHSVR